MTTETKSMQGLADWLRASVSHKPIMADASNAVLLQWAADVDAATPASAAEAVPHHEYWSVRVESNECPSGLVSIGWNWLAGKPNLTDSDEATIRYAAHHLLAFLGDPSPKEVGISASEAAPWQALFNEVASALNCLPSMFPDANAHVIRKAKALATPPPAPQPPNANCPVKCESMAQCSGACDFMEAAPQPAGVPDIETVMRSTVRRVIHELNTYNPAADEYKGKYIHGVWARELTAALASLPEPIPAGWKMVPVEPTPEMLDSGAMEIAMNHQRVQTAERGAEYVYRAMVAAASTQGGGNA